MLRAVSDRSLGLAGLVLGALALLISLNAGSWAVAAVSSLKKNSVTSTHIVDGTIRSGDIATGAVRGSDIRNATIGLADLSPALGAKLATTGTPGPAGAIGPVGADGPAGPGLGDGGVTTAKLAGDAVTTAKVALDSLLAADLATGSVGSPEVLDHTLVAADISKSTGSATIDYSSLGPGVCQGASVGVGTTTAGEVILATPGSNWPAGLTYTVQPAATSNMLVVACNVSTAIVDAPSTTFRYVVLDT